MVLKIYILQKQKYFHLPGYDIFITLDWGKVIFFPPTTVYGLLGGTGGGLS